MKKKKFKSSAISRFASFSKTVAIAGGHLAIDRVGKKVDKISQKKREFDELKHKIAAAREIIKQMSHLKGALMKLGQMISITEDLVLPPEISKLFRELQKSAPPMSEKDLNQVFKKSLGKLPEEVFQTFDRSPMAAASIGQVHKATLPSGELVAVKVQYPKIVNAIKSDFKNLEQLKKLITLIFPDTPDVNNYLEELKRTLLEECDYQKEANNILWFRKNLMTKNSGIYIPNVFPEFSSSQILTMEFVEGDDYETTKKYSSSQKNELGQALYDAHMYSLFYLNKMHTDPQNGNYLFTPEKIILLDFGSIREFPDEFIKHYIDIIRSIEIQDFDLYQKSIRYLGYLENEEDTPLLKEHFKLISDLYLPYTKKGLHPIHPQNPFRMVDSFVKKVNLKGRKAPREEFLLLDRSNLGLYTKLKYWGSEIDWLTSKHAAWDAFTDKTKSSQP